MKYSCSRFDTDPPEIATTTLYTGTLKYGFFSGPI